MVPLTRRRLLQGATVLSVGLAGCSGASSSSSSSPSPPMDAENVELDPEHVALRDSDDEPVAWIGSVTTDTKSTPTERDRPISDHETGLIASADQAARLMFADVDARAEARSFVDAADFETETLLLVPRKVAECYRLELCAVTWSASSYHTYFGRTLRPAEVACETDTRDRVAYLIRIPDTLDPAQVTSRGSGSSSGSCAKFRQRFERERGRRSAGGSDR